jgi:4-carboxymuconolactone decarboxylase
VSAKTVRDLKAGRVPKSAPKDERAIYEFVQELYKARRISDRTYKKVRSFLSDESMVELVGVLGYYSLISMTLNVFQMLPPLEDGLAFPET